MALRPSAAIWTALSAAALIAAAHGALRAARASEKLTASGRDRYDLATDWGDSANPNGPWTYREGTNALPRVAAWQRGDGTYSGEQPGWARSESGDDRVPLWYRTLGLENFGSPVDVRVGDVLVHTNNDPTLTGNGNANVVWTSPRAGMVDVDGALWIPRDIGRSNDWFVYLNSTLLTQGSLATGSGHDRAHPLRLAAGSGGGTALRGLPVVAGDEVRLEFVKSASFGDLVGVNLSVAFASSSIAAATGGAAPVEPSLPVATFASLGPPSIDGSGGVAFRGTLKTATGGPTKANASGIWTAGSAGLTLVVRQGTFDNSTGGRFASFGDPVNRSDGSIAFVGKLKPGIGGVTAANASGVWTNVAGFLANVARQGDVAPGADGAKFAQFLALALPEGSGPVFLAKVAASNGFQSTSVFGADESNVVNEVIGFGDAVSVGGVLKPIQSLAFLPKAKIVGGQTRGFDGGASIAVLATFADKTSAVLALPLRRGALTTSGVPPTVWQSSDSNLGVAGFTVEDFESPDLANGLQVQLSGGSADFGPTSTLPHAFDPSADDPGNSPKVLVPGVWDGAHVLLNRRDAPIPAGYNDGEWADLTLSVAGGASSIGFSLEQMEVASTPITVTTTSGVVVTTAGAIPNYVNGDTQGGRNGYVRFDAPAGAKILSVKIDNQSGDGFALDHVAFRRAPALPAKSDLAAVGDVAPGANNAKFKSFGPPLLDGSAHAAFAAKLATGPGVTSTTGSGVWVETDAGLGLVARAGDEAAGVAGAFFASFGDPVARADDACAFLAKLRFRAGGVTAANASGIWTNAGGALALTARQGSSAPGTTATFKSFSALAMPDGGGPVFSATLAGAGVTKADGAGVWACDAVGAPHLVMRAGDSVDVNGAEKTVAKIEFLPTVKVVGGQSRGFDRAGDLVLRVICTDKTQAIVRILR